MNDGNEDNKSQSSANKTEIDVEPKENELRNSTSYNEDDKQPSLRDSIGSTQSISKSYDQRDIEFGFFYDLNKKMILKRSDVGDISTFSYWLKALSRVQDKEVRNDYIKLMTLALQHPEPVCPFKDPPPEQIDPLEYGVIEMARKYRKGDGNATCIGKNETEPDAKPNPKISTAVSHDRRRYASCQIIPNFGVQCYYAFSDDHLFNWTMPPQFAAPKEGPHAKDFEWERAFAGIRATSGKPDAENDKSEKEDDSTTKALAGSSGLTKKNTEKSLDKGKCNVMYVDQQNRNFTEEFRWNDASLLTRAMVLGAEAITDCKIDTQIKTQLAIDEEATSVHDKLYPGDFKIQVNPSVLDDILLIQKCADMESGDKNTTVDQDDKNIKPQSNDRNGNDNNGKPNTNSKNNHNRQKAGQEKVNFTDDNRSGDSNNKDEQNQKPSESAADHRKPDNSKNTKHFKRPKPIYSSRVGDVPCNKKKTNVCQPERVDDTNLLFEKASLELKRQVDITKKCFNDVKSLIKNNRSKESSRNCSRDRKNFSDSDALSDM